MSDLFHEIFDINIGRELAELAKQIHLSSQVKIKNLHGASMKPRNPETVLNSGELKIFNRQIDIKARTVWL
jgi:hypothetical protein